MPAQRKKSTFQLDLGDLVTQQSTIFKNVRVRSQDISESRFQQRVTTEGLSYATQLDYYSKLLAREQNKRQPDSDYTDKINTNISNLKKLVRVDSYNQSYRASLESLNSGKKSIDDHISFLQDQLGSAVDLDLRDKIKDAVTSAQADKYTIQKNILNNKVQYALKDKTIDILQSMLDTVDERRTTALQGGDEEWASALSISALTLKQQIASSKIEHQINDFIAGSAVADDNPITYLNRINDQISLSDVNDSVTVNGTAYDNASAYWQSQKDSYLSSGKFYNELTDYYKKIIDADNTRSQDSLVPSLQIVKNTLSQLVNQPDLANYKEGMKNTTDLIVGYGANIAGGNVLTKSGVDFDFANAAKKLSKINTDLGIDMTSQYNDLVSQVAQINSVQANNIVSLAQEQISAGKSEADALAYAIKYAPNVVSTIDTATKTPEQLATEAVKGAPGAKGVTLPKSAETPVGGQTGQTAEGNYKMGSYIKLPNSPTVYKVVGGNQLQPLVGPWTEQDFQEATGKNFAQGIQTVSNVAGYTKASDAYEFMKESAGIKAPSTVRKEVAEKARLDEIKRQQDEAKQREQQQQQNQPGGGTTPPAGGGGAPAATFKEGGVYKNPNNAEIFKYQGGQLHWIQNESVWKKIYGNKPIEGSYEPLPSGGAFGETIDDKNYSKYV